MLMQMQLFVVIFIWSELIESVKIVHAHDVHVVDIIWLLWAAGNDRLK